MVIRCVMIFFTGLFELRTARPSGVPRDAPSGPAWGWNPALCKTRMNDPLRRSSIRATWAFVVPFGFAMAVLLPEPSRHAGGSRRCGAGPCLLGDFLGVESFWARGWAYIEPGMGRLLGLGPRSETPFAHCRGSWARDFSTRS